MGRGPLRPSILQGRNKMKSKYLIWQFCERWGIRSLEVKKLWGDNDVQTQALIIAYNQINQGEIK